MKQRLLKLNKNVYVAILAILLILILVYKESIVETSHLCGLAGKLLGSDCLVAYKRGMYIDFLPDGQHIIRSKDGRTFAIQPVNLTNTFSSVEFGLEEHPFPEFYMREHAGSSDLSRVAACVSPDDQTDEIWVWDVETQMVIQKIPDSNCKMEGRLHLLLSEDGRYVVSNAEEHIQLFDLENEERLIREGKGQTIVSSAQDLLVFIADENTIKLVDINGEETEKEILLPKPIEQVEDVGLAISANGSLLALNDAGHISLWQITDGSLVSELEPAQASTGFLYDVVSFSEDGKFVASNVYHWNDEENLVIGYVYIWNVENGDLQWQKRIGESVIITAVSISPDNSLVAVGTGQGSFVFKTNIVSE